MMATQLAERRDDPVAVVRQTLTTMGDQLKMALPSHVSVDKFHRVTMTALQQTPALLNCDRRSLFAAITKAAQDGLLPDGREGALVKFRTKRDGQYIDAVQWMPMIGGILKKVRQSGELASIDALLVHAADRFAYRPGFDEVPLHEPDWFGDRGPVIGAYAVARLRSGAAMVEIMNRQQIEQVRAVSRSKDDGPWSAWWGEMARKTVLRRLAKRLPMSTDIEAEFERDETMTADVAAAVMATPQPASVSRLDALEQRLGIAGPDEQTEAEADPEPDPDEIPTPAAAEEAAGQSPQGETGEAAAPVSEAKPRRTPAQMAAAYQARVAECADIEALTELQSKSRDWLASLLEIDAKLHGACVQAGLERMKALIPPPAEPDDADERDTLTGSMFEGEGA